MRKCLLVLCACVVWIGTACAGTNVGVGDYYRVKPEGTGPQPLVLKFEKTGQGAILPGQPFSINLSAGFAGDFLEVGRKGELAIIARVIERGSGKSGLEFGANAAKSGRLIYYSDDVYENQPLSFSYIPIYGPMKYSGKPVDIQLYVMEIDDVDKLKPLLHTLTKAGQGLYPPAAPILGLLDTLGSALLSAAKDDVMFEYSLSLWPKAPNSSEQGFQVGEFPVLEAGHYIFTRQKDRKNASDHFKDNVRMKAGNHKLVVKSKKGFKDMYKDDYYLVLHIKRDSPALALDEDNDYYKTFAAFRQAEADSTEEYATKVNTELARLGAEFIRANQRKSLYTLYDGVGGATKGDETYVIANANKLLNQLKSEIAKRKACADGDDACGGAMLQDELLQLLSLMRSTAVFAAQKDQLTYDKLGNADIATIVDAAAKALPVN